MPADVDAAPALPGVRGATNPGRLKKLPYLLESARKKYLTRDKTAPVVYTGSSLALSLAQMIAGFMMARWILPQELGLWQSVFVALTYSYLLLGGINNGLSRELPYYLGTGNQDTAMRLTGTTQFLTRMGSTFVLLLGATAVFVANLRHYDGKLILALATVTLLIVFSFQRNYLTVTFRSRSSFITLSWNQALEAGLMLASLPLVYYLRYSGMLLRLVLVSAVVVYFMHRSRPVKVASAWDWTSLRMLLKTGIPIFALDYLQRCSGTLGLIALLRFGGVTQVGYFAVAASACAAFEVIPSSVAHYVYPRMSYQYGRDRKSSALWGPSWKVSVLLIAVMLPLAILGWACIPWVVANCFPKYIAGTRAAQLMLFAAVGTGLTVCTNALWSMKAWTAMIVYQVASSILTAAGPFVGIWLFGSPLIGVASGIVMARTIIAVFALAVTYVSTRDFVGR